MYNNKRVLFKNNEGKKIIRKLFLSIVKNPKKYLTIDQLKRNKYRAIADYISGMTDRYAINLYMSTK
jgi:dGTPase